MEGSISGIGELTLKVAFGQWRYERFPGNKSVLEIDIFHCNGYFKTLLHVFLISNVMFG